MKNLFKKLVSGIRNAVRHTAAATKSAIGAVNTILGDPFGFTKQALAGNAGEGYIDTAVKILIAVVLGALLLAGLYALFGDVVMPTLKSKIQGMFNYAG